MYPELDSLNHSLEILGDRNSNSSSIFSCKYSIYKLKCFQMFPSSIPNSNWSSYILFWEFIYFCLLLKDLNLENDYNLSIFRFLIIAYLPFLGNSVLNYLHKNITLRINIAKLSIARHIRPVIVGYWFEKCHFFVFM